MTPDSPQALSREQIWSRLTDKEWFGEPCEEFDPDCTQCLYWLFMKKHKRMQEDLQSIANICSGTPGMKKIANLAQEAIDFDPLSESSPST